MLGRRFFLWTYLLGIDSSGTERNSTPAGLADPALKAPTSKSPIRHRLAARTKTGRAADWVGPAKIQ